MIYSHISLCLLTELRKVRDSKWVEEKEEELVAGENEVRGRVLSGGDAETEYWRRAFQLQWPDIALEDMN